MNSPLVTCEVKSPNHSGKRTHAIDRITPHCVVGQLSAKNIGGCFLSKEIKASCNYGIGTEGDICLVVDEDYRSWCSSSNDNDQRAVTIECASDMKEPYAFNSTVYYKLIDLCEDICKRNRKDTLVWIPEKDRALAYKLKDNEMLLTVHRWFKPSKSCPGNWLMTRLQLVAEEVSRRCGGRPSPGNAVPKKATTLYAEVLIHNLNFRSEPSLKGKALGQTGKGVFEICELNGDWARLATNRAWIFLGNPGYARLYQGLPPRQVRVTADALNVRKGAGKDYPIVTTVKKGSLFTISQEIDGWGKLANDKGWISLKYTEKV